MIEQLNEVLMHSGLFLGENAEKLSVFHELLLEWNEKIDLTNVPAEEMYLRHYADSILPLTNEQWFFPGASFIDVGAGAGFPGMAIAILRPDMKICLLDALGKRCVFLEHVVKELNLLNVRVIHARSEDAARSELRGSFDIAAARAVAKLRTLLEYLMPFVKVGGTSLCWKGPGLDMELLEAKTSLILLKGQAGERMRLNLPGMEHCVQSFKKTASTPSLYPRKAGVAKRNPL